MTEPENGVLRLWSIAEVMAYEGHPLQAFLVLHHLLTHPPPSLLRRRTARENEAGDGSASNDPLPLQSTAFDAEWRLEELATRVRAAELLLLHDSARPQGQASAPTASTASSSSSTFSPGTARRALSRTATSEMLELAEKVLAPIFATTSSATPSFHSNGSTTTATAAAAAGGVMKRGSYSADRRAGDNGAVPPSSTSGVVAPLIVDVCDIVQETRCSAATAMAAAAPFDSSDAVAFLSSSSLPSSSTESTVTLLAWPSVATSLQWPISTTYASVSPDEAANRHPPCNPARSGGTNTKDDAKYAERLPRLRLRPSTANIVIPVSLLLRAYTLQATICRRRGQYKRSLQCLAAAEQLLKEAFSPHQRRRALHLLWQDLHERLVDSAASQTSGHVSSTLELPHFDDVMGAAIESEHHACQAMVAVEICQMHHQLVQQCGNLPVFLGAYVEAKKDEDVVVKGRQNGDAFKAARPSTALPADWKMQWKQYTESISLLASYSRRYMSLLLHMQRQSRSGAETNTFSGPAVYRTSVEHLQMIQQQLHISCLTAIGYQRPSTLPLQLARRLPSLKKEEEEEAVDVSCQQWIPVEGGRWTPSFKLQLAVVVLGFYYCMSLTFRASSSASVPLAGSTSREAADQMNDDADDEEIAERQFFEAVLTPDDIAAAVDASAVKQMSRSKRRRFELSGSGAAGGGGPSRPDIRFTRLQRAHLHFIATEKILSAPELGGGAGVMPPGHTAAPPTEASLQRRLFELGQVQDAVCLRRGHAATRTTTAAAAAAGPPQECFGQLRVGEAPPCVSEHRHHPQPSAATAVACTDADHDKGGGDDYDEAVAVTAELPSWLLPGVRRALWQYTLLHTTETASSALPSCHAAAVSPLPVPPSGVPVPAAAAALDYGECNVARLLHDIDRQLFYLTGNAMRNSADDADGNTTSPPPPQCDEEMRGPAAATSTAGQLHQRQSRWRRKMARVTFSEDQLQCSPLSQIKLLLYIKSSALLRMAAQHLCQLSPVRAVRHLAEARHFLSVFQKQARFMLPEVHLLTACISASLSLRRVAEADCPPSSRQQGGSHRSRGTGSSSSSIAAAVAQMAMGWAASGGPAAPASVYAITAAEEASIAEAVGLPYLHLLAAERVASVGLQTPSSLLLLIRLLMALVLYQYILYGDDFVLVCRPATIATTTPTGTPTVRTATAEQEEQQRRVARLDSLTPTPTTTPQQKHQLHPRHRSRYATVPAELQRLRLDTTPVMRPKSPERESSGNGDDDGDGGQSVQWRRSEDGISPPFSPCSGGSGGLPDQSRKSASTTPIFSSLPPALLRTVSPLSLANAAATSAENEDDEDDDEGSCTANKWAATPPPRQPSRHVSHVQVVPYSTRHRYTAALQQMIDVLQRSYAAAHQDGGHTALLTAWTTQNITLLYLLRSAMTLTETKDDLAAVREVRQCTAFARRHLGISHPFVADGLRLLSDAYAALDAGLNVAGPPNEVSAAVEDEATPAPNESSRRKAVRVAVQLALRTSCTALLPLLSSSSLAAAAAMTTEEEEENQHQQNSAKGHGDRDATPGASNSAAWNSLPHQAAALQSWWDAEVLQQLGGGGPLTKQLISVVAFLPGIPGYPK